MLKIVNNKTNKINKLIKFNLEEIKKHNIQNIVGN